VFDEVLPGDSVRFTESAGFVANISRIHNVHAQSVLADALMMDGHRDDKEYGERVL
jgi:hypothetical protein